MHSCVVTDLPGRAASPWSGSPYSNYSQSVCLQLSHSFSGSSWFGTRRSVVSNPLAPTRNPFTIQTDTAVGEFDLQPPFCYCAQFCADSGLLARRRVPCRAPAWCRRARCGRVRWLYAPCAPADGRSVASLRNHCARPGSPTCTGSMCAAQRVRQVCWKVWGGNSVTFARVHAFGCCFFSEDFSTWPLRVGAGNTHSPSATARLISRMAAVLCDSGIVRRGFSVLPKDVNSAVLDVFPPLANRVSRLIWTALVRYIGQHWCGTDPSIRLP